MVSKRRRNDCHYFYSFLAENITLADIRFDRVWEEQLENPGSQEYQEFYNLLNQNVCYLLCSIQKFWIFD